MLELVLSCWNLCFLVGTCAFLLELVLSCWNLCFLVGTWDFLLGFFNEKETEVTWICLNLYTPGCLTEPYGTLGGPSFVTMTDMQFVQLIMQFAQLQLDHLKPMFESFDVFFQPCRILNLEVFQSFKLNKINQQFE